MSWYVCPNSLIRPRRQEAVRQLRVAKLDPVLGVLDLGVPQNFEKWVNPNYTEPTCN